MKKIDPKKVPFGSNLKALRKSMGLKQSEFGDVIETPQSCVSAWEAGQRLPNAQEIMLICYKFKISSDVLLGIPKEWKKIK